MIYSFSINKTRKIQSASHCYFDKPILHPSRIMPCHDFIYMVDGEWSVKVDNTSYVIKNGDVLILPANTPHYGIKPCKEKTKTMYFHVYPQNDTAKTEENDESSKITLLTHHNCSSNPNIKALFEKILQTKDIELVCTAYIHTLLYELSQLQRNDVKMSLASLIYDLISASDTPLSNYDIAKHFNVSTRTAELAFKTEYGITMQNALTLSRISKAAQYLKDYPNMKISSIAVALGFYDEFHFSKVFKKAIGVSPTEYKNKLNKSSNP